MFEHAALRIVTVSYPLSAEKGAS